MPRVSLAPTFGNTRMGQIAGHAAHIRHLCRSSALEKLLQERYSFARVEAHRTALEVSPFIEQALHFYDAAQSSTPRVRPVLQYYTFLNLAVAIVLIYRPTNWHGYRSHGAQDLTLSVQSISLSTPVVRVKHGALMLFHSIVSDRLLPRTPITLRALVTAIPMVVSELRHAFRINPLMLSVKGNVRVGDDAGNQSARSVFTFRLLDSAKPPPHDPGVHKFPLKRLYTALPALKADYQLTNKGKHSRTFESKQSWTIGNKDRAERFHEASAFKFINFGGQQVASPQFGSIDVNYFWSVYGTESLLPTATASLLLSYVLSSLSRYRARVLDRVENSKINLLCDVFANEADGFMIPLFRNLLYGECLYLAESEYT